MQEKNFNNIVRTRFAPAPSGMMHLGNVRTALMNYLFARQKNGKFVLRIEDTDPQRILDPNAEKILEILAWLGLSFDEGPIIGGPNEPYFQSKRTNIYEKALSELIEKKLVYRCFCTQEELEKKRLRQVALKQPPRYDRTCLNLTQEEIQDNLDKNVPFVWRVKIDQNQKITFFDMARKELEFDLKNFSDFPITRQDGSFTFIFANCVDDIQMCITHVIRGEDHLSNTVDQIVLYKAFEKPVPIFWHMQTICDIEGKKLSKSCFAFSVADLKNEGYMPEAICNYLAIIGTSFKDEFQSLNDLVKNYDFENIHSTGHIKYDIEKFRWLNHKWISAYSDEKLAKACLPFISNVFREVLDLDKNKLNKLISVVKTDLVTLKDSVMATKFYFEKPLITRKDIENELKINSTEIKIIFDLIQNNISLIQDPNKFIQAMKNSAKENNISNSILFPFLRFVLTGLINGPHVHDLIEVLGKEEVIKRFNI